MRPLNEAEKFDHSIVDGYNNLAIHWNTKVIDRDEASVKAQHARLSKHFAPHLSTQPNNHTNPYYRYTESESKGLNKLLAAKHTNPDAGYTDPAHDHMMGLHKQLDAAIKSAPATPEHIVAFSGLGSRRIDHVMAAAKKGGEHTFPAYTSTSIRFTKATGFGRTQSSNDEDSSGTTQHFAVFHIPKNSRGVVYAGETSTHPTEQELIVHAGAKTVYSHTTVHKANLTATRSYTIKCHHFLYQQPEWADHPHDGHPFPEF